MPTYEWDIETVVSDDNVENQDIVNHDHSDQLDFPDDVLRDAINGVQVCGHFTRLVLVCDDNAGRSWAYVESGELPTHFKCCYGDPAQRVPKRFHSELARAMKRIEE